MHILRSSAIESWNQPRLKINSLTFYKMDFHTQNVSKKLFCTWMGVRAFWKHFECENPFCKKSRNLSWVGAGFSFKWLNFSKNAWTFALFEIWSDCRCDMKIIFGVFDNLDAKLLSHKIFWCYQAWSFDSGSVYFISECQGHRCQATPGKTRSSIHELSLHLKVNKIYEDMKRAIPFLFIFSL